MRTRIMFFSTFTVSRACCFLPTFSFSGKTTNWRCASSEKVLRISLCYYLIFFFLLHRFLLFHFWSKFLGASFYFVCCELMSRKTSEKKLRKEAKNNEKRHNYNACIIFLLLLMVVPSSYDNYTIKTHKFGTQKSVFLHSLLLPCSPSSAHGKNRKMRKKLNRFDPHEIVWSWAGGQWISFFCVEMGKKLRNLSLCSPSQVTSNLPRIQPRRKLKRRENSTFRAFQS